MNESNVERMRELEKAATQAAEAMKHESDNNMCALYQTNIVRFNKAIDKTAPALLEITEAVEYINDPSPTLDDDTYMMVRNGDLKRLKAALAKFNSLKIEGL